MGQRQALSRSSESSSSHPHRWRNTCRTRTSPGYCGCGGCHHGRGIHTTITRRYLCLPHLELLLLVGVGSGSGSVLYSAQFCANCSPRLVKTTGRLLVLLQFLNCLPVFFFIFVGSFKELTVSAPIYGPTSLDRPIEKLGLLLPCHTEITLQETIEIRNEGIHLFTAEFFGQRLVIDITSILFVTRIYDAAKVESALSWLGTSKVMPGQLWPTADCSTKR